MSTASAGKAKRLCAPTLREVTRRAVGNQNMLVDDDRAAIAWRYALETSAVEHFVGQVEGSIARFISVFGEALRESD